MNKMCRLKRQGNYLTDLATVHKTFIRPHLVLEIASDVTGNKTQLPVVFSVK